MKQTLLALLPVILFAGCQGQSLVSKRENIDKEKAALKAVMQDFDSCMVKSGLNGCEAGLLKNAGNEYQQYLIGGLLYDIDTAQSFKLHQQAFLANPHEQNFTLEYAIELHRKGAFADAIPLYENYLAAVKDDNRVLVWLADCYINTGNVQRAIDNWKKADHARHHTAIDQAIYTIYGNTGQLAARSRYREEIEKGNNALLYALVFLDMNWELDWWNKNIQEYFLEEDMHLLETKLAKNSNDYKTLQAYISIKKLSGQENQGPAIKATLQANSLVIDAKPLPANGPIASDLMRICFMNKLLSETDFYNNRGNELLNLAKQTKDKELLNIYAYLQASVKGEVDPAIDKMGWTEFKDERFAISYFMGKADKNRFDDPELATAIADFPQSSQLYWVKTNCAKIEKKDMKPVLTELIKREFKTLGSDETRFSYKLNSFFGYLAEEK